MIFIQTYFMQYLVFLYIVCYILEIWITFWTVYRAGGLYCMYSSSVRDITSVFLCSNSLFCCTVLYSVQYTQDAIPRHEPFIFVFDEVSLKSSQFTISVIGRSCNSYFFLVFTRHWGCKYIFGEREGEILSVQRSNLHELPVFFIRAYKNQFRVLTGCHFTVQY